MKTTINVTYQLTKEVELPDDATDDQMSAAVGAACAPLWAALKDADLNGADFECCTIAALDEDGDEVWGCS